VSGHLARWRSNSARAAGCFVALTMALAISQAACQREDPFTIAGTVTLVNRVRAEVRCSTVATCEPKLEAALRPRLEPAAITISADPKTIDLKFERTASVFSSASFRQAVTQAGGEVTMLGIEACGTISQTEGRSWITSGSTRLLLDGAGPFITGTEICVSGELRDQISPPTLVPRKLSD
jgi:hypothetical protein